MYFSFLRPFADVAGAHALEWDVPRESLDVYDMLSMFEGAPADSPVDNDTPYYTPFPT